MKKVARISATVLLAALVLPLMFSALNTYETVAAVNGQGNIYVDASRPDDSGNGLSWATAFKTIGAAISAVNHPGIIHVAAGTYREHLYLDDTFELVGAGAPVTTIDGGGVGQVIRVSRYIGQTNTISGFTIQNGNVNGSAPAEEVMMGGETAFAVGMPVGGGVYVAINHTVTMNDCVIRNNTASFLGGGIYNAGDLYMNRCTVSGNSSGMVGGGIANFSDGGQTGFMSLKNCTIYGNSVTGATWVSTVKPGDAGEQPALLGPPQLWIGGGVFNGGDAEFWNVTIANNSVPSGLVAHGGGIANVPLQCTNGGIQMLGVGFKNRAMFINTIVANNVPDNGYNDEEATILSLGNSIDSQNNCGFTGKADQVNTNPLLGPLQDNGGTTPTMAICTNSPAFNRGADYTHITNQLNAATSDVPDTDQRGVARPQAGIYDIGAFETVPISVTTLDAGASGIASATLNGNLLSGTGGAPVHVSFQYGSSPDTFSGNSVLQLMTSAGPFSAVLTGLPFGMCYYRAMATGDCTAYGQVNSIAILPPLINSGSSNAGAGAGTGTGSPVGLPNITILSASLSSVSATPGSPVTVTANIANRGAVNGATAVKLYVNGQEDTTRGITINSGSNVPVTFTIYRNEPGTYTVYVGGTSAGSFTVDGSSDPNIVLYISVGMIVAALIAFVFYIRRRQNPKM